MRRRNLLAAAIVLPLLCSTTGTAPQDLAVPPEADPARGNSVITLCPDFKATSAPCDDYIGNYYGTHGDLIIGTLDAIDRHKDRARQEAASNKFWDRIASGTLITLGLLTTVLATVARAYRDVEDRVFGLEVKNLLGIFPIFMLALVTAMASFVSYYKFDESRSRHTLVANELAKAQSGINFELLQRVVEGTHSDLTVNRIKGWQDAIDRAMTVYTESQQSNGDTNTGTGEKTPP